MIAPAPELASKLALVHSLPVRCRFAVLHALGILLVSVEQFFSVLDFQLFVKASRVAAASVLGSLRADVEARSVGLVLVVEHASDVKIVFRLVLVGAAIASAAESTERGEIISFFRAAGVAARGVNKYLLNDVVLKPPKEIIRALERVRVGDARVIGAAESSLEMKQLLVIFVRVGLIEQNEQVKEKREQKIEA